MTAAVRHPIPVRRPGATGAFASRGCPPATVLAERKSRVRQRIAQRLRHVSPEEWRMAGERVAAALETLATWRRARRIAVYLHTPREVPATQSIARCRQREGDVYLPVYDRHGGRCVPALWRDADSLRRGAHGILEPAYPAWAPDVVLDLVLTPGRAFTRTGMRLGRGGGYYDRFLSAPWAARAVNVGLALECQMVDDALAGAHDVGMDWVITEKTIYAGYAVPAAGPWEMRRGTNR